MILPLLHLFSLFGHLWFTRSRSTYVINEFRSYPFGSVKLYFSWLCFLLYRDEYTVLYLLARVVFLKLNCVLLSFTHTGWWALCWGEQLHAKQKFQNAKRRIWSQLRLSYQVLLPRGCFLNPFSSQSWVSLPQCPAPPPPKSKSSYKPLSLRVIEFADAWSFFTINYFWKVTKDLSEVS